MKAIVYEKYCPPEVLQLKEVKRPVLRNSERIEAFEALKQGVCAALETYSNVHRGSGHYSIVTTHLYEQTRDIVLKYLGLNKKKYAVIFCSPARAEVLKTQLEPDSFQSLSSRDIGLSFGVRALAVKRRALTSVAPSYTGGGTARLVSRDWVVWAKTPDKFEAGTPAIINIIAFAKALQLLRHFGISTFRHTIAEKPTADEILYHDDLEKYSGREMLEKLRQNLTGRGICVPTVEGVKPYINLDNGASTPTFEPIWNTVYRTWQQSLQTQQEIIQKVKSICAKALGAPLETYEVIFTSNTTEAINLAAENLRNKPVEDIEPVVLNTLLEHNSNELPWRKVPGLSLIRLSVDAEGFVDLNKLEMLLQAYNLKGEHGKKRIGLVAVSGASNVLGVFNNLVRISEIVHRYSAHLLVDAAQLVAHRKIDMKEWGIDYLAFSAHKIYAPFGSGALVVRKGLLHFTPAETELIRLSGEENAGGIAALGKAFVLLQRIGFDLIQQKEQALTANTLHGLAQIPGITIYGIKDTESSGFAQKGGVIVFGLNKTMPNQVAKKLALQGGIGVRYGCHCTHLLIKHLLHVGPFLERFQGLIIRLLPRLELPGLVRVSLGIQNNEEDVDALIHVLRRISWKSGAGNCKNSSFQGTRMPVLLAADVRHQVYGFVRAVSQRVYNLSNKHDKL